MEDFEHAAVKTLGRIIRIPVPVLTSSAASTGLSAETTLINRSDCIFDAYSTSKIALWYRQRRRSFAMGKCSVVSLKSGYNMKIYLL